MKVFLEKIALRTKILISIFLIVSGLSLGVLNFYRSYHLEVNGSIYTVKALAFTPEQIIRASGLALRTEDRVFPDRTTVLLNQNTIVLEQAFPLEIWLNGEKIQQLTTERIPANLLGLLGYKLYPEDRLLWNGINVLTDFTLPFQQGSIIQYVPAHQYDLAIDGNSQTLFSCAPIVGEALKDAGITIGRSDVVSVSLDTRLETDEVVAIQRAKPVMAAVGNQQVQGLSAAVKVAEVIRDLGLSLQGMDYAIPTEDAVVPDDGMIQIVRVSEEIQLLKEETAYQNTYLEDPDAELDTTSILTPGQLGLVITRTRSRWEDGTLVAEETEGPWKASEPMDGVIGLGSKVVVRTETINGDTITYWRKVSVYATSYMPSSQGGSTGTASGIPLTKGVVAVTLAWYRGMAFQPVYIPGYGYGTIADTGGGIPGRYWIDLGFDNDNYESWHTWTTMYFLTPVPAFIPVILP